MPTVDLTPRLAREGVHFSFGRFTTNEDIEAAVRLVLDVLDLLSSEPVKMPA